MITFLPDGTIETANANFLALMGHELEGIVGRHHRIFVEPDEAEQPAYGRFWERLASGEAVTAEFKRRTRSGEAVWIQASYNPVHDEKGRVLRVVKVATDITAQKALTTDAAGQLLAIGKSQAVIAFDLSGHILEANENFCAVLGYARDEIVGRHHRMFVEPEEARSEAYLEFWERLRAGTFEAAQYRRIGKGGREVWIQATYNPILDADGRPYKVVKFATDITARKAAIDALGSGLVRLAAGDLSRGITQAVESDLEPIRLAYNHTIETFGAIVSRLRDTSDSLKSATGEILSGAHDLSVRTSRQAAAVEETSAAMAHLAEAVIANANRALSASAGAGTVSQTATETGESMAGASTAMTRIEAASKRISNIVGLIDDIAFQTNLLALNASVEAARAGDAGKGFAVVAVEVRRLAQSAAGASRDIKALIEESGREVSEGTKMVTRTAERLDTMVKALRTNAELIEQIARANQQQASAIGEVEATMRQMDEMTQHNAALVEETNAAIGQTEAQAQLLDSLVEQFRIAGDIPQAAARRAA
jgi:methyl-accepting chemotaxis protein